MATSGLEQTNLLVLLFVFLSFLVSIFFGVSFLLILFAFLALVACASGLAAQQPLTLQEAISMAQKQGPSAQVARSVRDAARARNDAFNAGLLPQVMLQGNAANLTHGINAVQQNDGSIAYRNQSQNTSTLGLAVAQKIPLTGGTLAFGSEASRFDAFGDNVDRQYSTTPFFIRLEQDLFKPRNLVWDEKLQSLNAGVAERAYLEAREDVAGNIAGAFFDLYAAEMSLRNASAMTTFRMLGPRTIISPISRMIGGIACAVSTKRWMT